MRFRNLRTVALLSIALIFSWSCEGYLDQFDFSNIDTEMEIEPNVALPVAYGSFSIQDVLESIDSRGFVEQTDEGLIYIYYRDTIYTIAATEFLEVPDATIAESYFESTFDVPGWLDLLNGETFVYKTSQTLTFSDSDLLERLDSVFFGGGILEIDLFSDFQHEGRIKISSPNIFDSYEDTLALDLKVSDINGGYINKEQIDLSGYKMRAMDENGEAVYRLFFTLELTKSTAGINTGESAGVSIGFSGLNFTEVYGYIAPKEIFSISQSLDLGIFENVSDVLNFEFKDPNLNLYVHNSFGIPVNIDVTKFEAVSSKDDQLYELTFIPGMMPRDILAPGLDQVGETVTDTIKLNSQTSNIDVILNQLPKLIDFDISASTGSIEETSQSFFLTKDSEVVVETEIVLPMWLKTDGYALEDTLEFNFEEDLGEIDILKSAEFNLKTINELPLEIDLQVYFLDENYLKLDSLFRLENPFIEAAPVDADGLILRDQLTENLSTISFTEEQLAKIKDTKYIKFYGNAFTSDNGADFVKFYSDYRLNYKLSVNAQFKLNSDEL